MSFSISKRNFLEVITKAFPFVPSKSSLSIILNFKMIFTPQSLEIIATDLDHSIILKKEIEGEGNFDITLNAKKLLEIVRELHDDILTLNIDENVLIIDSGGSFNCKISGADTRDFPSFPNINEYDEFDIPLKSIINMVQKTSFAVSKDSSRGCLCGISFDLKNERISMVATDGHRLGSTFINYEYEKEINSVISPKTLNALIKIGDNSSENNIINIKLSEKYVVLYTDDFTIYSKLINGPYPDYNKVIPKNNPKQIIVNKGLLFEAVRRVSVLSNIKTHLVRFIFRRGELEILVTNSDIGGEANQLVEIEYDGEEHSVGFNAAYFSEILNIIKSDKVRIEMNTLTSACLIYPIDEEYEKNDTYLIMPLRITDGF